MSPFFYYFSFLSRWKTFLFLLRCLLYTFDSLLLLLLSPFFPHLLVWKCYHFRFVSLFTKDDSRTKPCRFLSHSPSVFLIQWVCNVNLLEKTIETYIKIIYLFYIGNRFCVYVCLSEKIERWKRKSVIRCKRKIKK